MAQPNNKIPQYIDARVQGLTPKDAAISVGYSLSGLAVTTCRLEARDDVKAAIRKGKRTPKVVPPRGTPQVESDDDVAKPAWKLRSRYNTPLDLLIDLMNNEDAPSGVRYQAAKDALPYCHARKESGKTDDKKDKATEANKGKFGAMPVPLRKVA